MVPKTGYKHGIATSNAVNPTGDNYAANFARGVRLYVTDTEAKKLRAEKVDTDTQAAREYLLQISSR